MTDDASAPSPSGCPPSAPTTATPSIDEYAWLADKDDPETIAYLEAENAYTDAATAHLAALRETLFDEIKSRTQETDLSVPTRKGGYWYYTRTVEGQQYGIQCRRAVAAGRDRPAGHRRRRPAATARRCCSTATCWPRATSSSRSARSTSARTGSRLAYSTDFAGDERFTLRVKDLRTGEVLRRRGARTRSTAAPGRPTAPRCST